jgi:dTDP-glucose pyrophosphorylase
MKDISVTTGISIRKAMKKMSKLGEKCLVIVDEKNILLGTLSDGDLRKAILNGSEMSSSVENIYEANPTILIEGKYSEDEVKKLFTQNRFDLIPVVSNDGKLSNIIYWGMILNDGKERNAQNLEVPVVIMAGGKGTRMQPFTMVLPKPLIPIHEKPIIELIVEKFTNIGCSDFHLTVNYMSKILKAYFEELQPKYNVYFVDEDDPLGTAGGLQLLQGQLTVPFFVTNCDIIVDTDYLSLYKFHKKGDYDITLVASAKEYVIPYGICELNEEGHLSGINEKPEFDYFINTGLYILNPEILNIIPKNKFYHITDLIKEVKNQGGKVGLFPIDDEDWIDIGQWADYKKAIDKLT